MEWTTELRYKPYEEWSAQELLQLQAQAANSQYQMAYHIRPQSGLLNDPNGFSYYNNQWHVFYQSFPFGAAHGLKSWMHLVSDDLVHWRNLGLALAPDTPLDSHGAYSGSAAVIDDKLLLMYTGNVRTKEWERISYQNGAWLDKNGKITKLPKPLIEAPEHVTEHFRDPQLLKYRGEYYVILGAQDKTTLSGKVALFKSNDLEKWQDLGYVDFTDDVMGYMIECPNLVFIDDKPVLIFCPQGLEHEVADYQNIYPNMYVAGEHFKFNAGKLQTQQKAPINLDDGFDVYATQAFNAPDGKAYAISWVGLPDLAYPSDSENWAGCLSQVKVLSLDADGKLIQQPVPAMADLRQAGTVLRPEANYNQRQQLVYQAGNHYELKLNLDANQSGSLHLAANKDASQSLKIDFSTQDHGYVTVDRAHTGISFNEEYGTTRTVNFDQANRLELDIFIDGSLFEIFVNGGRHVITGRFFSQPDNQQIALTSEIALDFTGTYWPLQGI
ncbi:sucrose-6-phosphate hydrolase [Ligilactobacillus equi]